MKKYRFIQTFFFNLLYFVQRKLHSFKFFFYYSVQQPLYRLIFYFMFYLIFFFFINPYPIFFTIYAMERQDQDLLHKVQETSIELIDQRLNEIRRNGQEAIEGYIVLLTHVSEGLVDNVHPVRLGPERFGWESLLLWVTSSFILFLIIHYWPNIRDLFFNIGRTVVENMETIPNEAARFSHLRGLAHELAANPQTQQIVMEILSRSSSA